MFPRPVRSWALRRYPGAHGVAQGSETSCTEGKFRILSRRRRQYVPWMPPPSGRSRMISNLVSILIVYYKRLRVGPDVQLLPSQASNLRVGPAKTRVVEDCRAAIKVRLMLGLE